jgi:hypothetical protein
MLGRLKDTLRCVLGKRLRRRRAARLILRAIAQKQALRARCRCQPLI